MKKKRILSLFLLLCIILMLEQDMVLDFEAFDDRSYVSIRDSVNYPPLSL